MNAVLKYGLLIMISMQVLSCKSVTPVLFETPVDTSSKKITLQDKKTYTIPSTHVYVNNSFDGARISSVQKINDSTANIFIKPENTPINPSPYYAFKAWADTTKNFTFIFNYPEGFKHRYFPKIKEDNQWHAIDSSSVLVHDTITSIRIRLSRNPILIAAQEIQSSKDVEQWYQSVQKTNPTIVHLKSAGKSKLGRNIPVLDIYKGSFSNKPIIVLLTRQHPPEVTGYYAFQSFVSTLLEDSVMSEDFFTQYRVIAFPIVNPDGVDLGHWRHNAGGVDLNRDWSHYNQPEIKQVVRFITKQLKKQNTPLLLGLDFHSTWYDVFYTNKERASTTMPNFIDDWFIALEKNIPHYKVNEQSANSKKPVSKGWFLNAHQAVGITYEIGDNTSKEDIKVIGKASAEQMMQLLINN